MVQTDLRALEDGSEASGSGRGSECGGWDGEEGAC